ncbi:MAG: aldo/keto reductase [Sphaerochaetaceae bacterium]
MKKLGFGLMRLPKNGDEIDIPQVCEMVDKYIESGFEYFDTAYVYPGSEVAFGKAVASRYPRSRFSVASKMSGWLLNDNFSAAQMFEEQKRRCCVDYFDYYLIHSFQNSRIQAYNKHGVWDFCRSKKESGGEHNRPHFYYEDLVSTRSARASECIQCGRCEKVCPQHLPIRSILAKSSALFDSRS